ncbi:MAG: internal scaffolding protein [Microviridae sp.]|nr:MAG: internal scaffolding protein [Microviridae sp.]
MKTQPMQHETEHHHQPIQRFRSAYGPRYRVPFTTPESELPFGRTKQSFKDECDINTILKKFQRTGLLEFVNDRQPQYGDVSAIDFQESMQTVARANEIFADLPSSIRKHFENSPEQFFSFIQDPSKHAEAVALGLYGGTPSLPTGSAQEPVKTAPEPSKA